MKSRETESHHTEEKEQPQGSDEREQEKDESTDWEGDETSAFSRNNSRERVVTRLSSSAVGITKQESTYRRKTDAQPTRLAKAKRKWWKSDDGNISELSIKGDIKTIVLVRTNAEQRHRKQQLKQGKDLLWKKSVVWKGN